MSGASATPIIELRGVRKSYGRVAAIEDVSLTIGPGEVVGLIGDNGAGKSTIVKLIMGYEQPTAGEILVDGEPRLIQSPAAARSLGIEPVYQDLALVGPLSLWRNFFLGRELQRFKFGPLSMMNRPEMKRICRSSLADLGITRVRTVEQEAELLSGGERQSLAITRATHFGARMLLLDEPTAALSVKETQRVLSTIAEASSQGLAVVLIDHNMNHVEPVADRIVVIEHGRVAATFNRGEASVDDLKGLLTRRRTHPQE